LGSRNRGHTGFSLDIFRPKYLEAYEEGFRFRKSQARIPVATLHKILRNRIYTGEFEYGGVRYKGTHEPLVDLATWQRVQEILDGRHLGKHRKVTHSFAYSGLIKCGHCGCSLVAELKKGRYVYYHCTGYRGKCGETYTPEKTLAQQFAAYFQELVDATNDMLRTAKTFPQKSSGMRYRARNHPFSGPSGNYSPTHEAPFAIRKPAVSYICGFVVGPHRLRISHRSRSESHSLGGTVAVRAALT
jgi:hypothetical protein